MSGQRLVLDPAIDGIDRDPEVGCDLIHGVPAILIGHVLRSESSSIGYCDRKSGSPLKKIGYRGRLPRSRKGKSNGTGSVRHRAANRRAGRPALPSADVEIDSQLQSSSALCEQKRIPERKSHSIGMSAPVAALPLALRQQQRVPGESRWPVKPTTSRSTRPSPVPRAVPTTFHDERPDSGHCSQCSSVPCCCSMRNRFGRHPVDI